MGEEEGCDMQQRSLAGMEAARHDALLPFGCQGGPGLIFFFCLPSSKDLRLEEMALSLFFVFFPSTCFYG